MQLFFFHVAKTTEKKPTLSENKLSVPEQKTVDSSPDISPGVSPIPRSSSIAHLQTASKLILSSRLVYSQPLDLPVGVEVIRATPSAGKFNFFLINPLIYLLVHKLVYSQPITLLSDTGNMGINGHSQIHVRVSQITKSAFCKSLLSSLYQFLVEKLFVKLTALMTGNLTSSLNVFMINLYPLVHLPTLI